MRLTNRACTTGCYERRSLAEQADAKSAAGDHRATGAVFRQESSQRTWARTEEQVWQTTPGSRTGQAYDGERVWRPFTWQRGHVCSTSRLCT